MRDGARQLRISRGARLGRAVTTTTNGLVAPQPMAAAVCLPERIASTGPAAVPTHLPTPPEPIWLSPSCAPPDVTVIIRYHDEPQSWLDGAVSSVLTQPGVTCEVLIVDDGSTRPPLLPTDPRVGLLLLPLNSGPAVAQNEGVRRARGIAVRMLSADDELPPNSLAAQYAPVRDDPGVMISFGLVVPWDGGDWPQNGVIQEFGENCTVSPSAQQSRRQRYSPLSRMWSHSSGVR